MESKVNVLTLFSEVPQKHAEKMDRIMNDDNIHVFCDCSINSDGCIGLGVCIVGQGNMEVWSKIELEAVSSGSIYGELKAVLYAIDVLKRTYFSSRITIYSDYTRIRQLIKKDSKHDYLLHVVDEISKEIAKLNTEIIITYLEFKKYNLFYRAAHYAARKVINTLT